MTWRATLSLVLAAATIPAQEAPDGKLAAARTALTAWLASDHGDTALLDKAVAAVLDAGDAAIAEVGARAKRAHADSDRHAGSGLDAVITHVAIGFLKRAQASDMTYDGQYGALRSMQPFVGKLFLQLLLETPDWFSQKDRYQLVFPLRDVYPESPGADVCRKLREVATDEDLESDSLRKNLPFALAQWGDRTLIDARIAQVTKDAAAADADAEERAALRYELADIHYTLREYERAAQIHVEMLRQAEATGADQRPVHYYNAACCLARAGAGQAALDELERAVKSMLSGRIDPSSMLKRTLFERDPDLASVRDSDRFRELVRAAFGEASDKKPGAKEPGHGEARKDG